MKTFLKIFASLLLFVNGIGAIYGGWNLITHPDGSSIELSLQFLKHTPFNDYFTPGIILFIANGLFSLFVLATIIFHFKNYAGYIIAQGVILTGWIIIQIIMIREIYYLQIVLTSVAVLLIMCGWILIKMGLFKNNNLRK